MKNSYALNLFWELTKKELKLRYKRSALGFAWSLLNPILFMIVFTIVFSRFPRIAQVDAPYPVFFLAGYIPWIFFSQALSSSLMSIPANAALVKQAAFPRKLLPMASVAANLFHFAAALLLLIIFLAAYPGAHLQKALTILPAAVALLTTFVLGIAFMLSAANAAFRDVGQIFEIGSAFLFYLTPIIYSFSIFNESDRLLKFLLALNPMAHFIGIFRSLLIGDCENPASWIYACVWAIASFTIGLRYINRREQTLAKEL
jgi:lipopolysaccharide transport system permease protein